MWRNFPSYEARDAVIDHLVNWAEQAKLAGRKARADDLINLAWFAYDQPVTRQSAPLRPISLAILQAFPGLADLSVRKSALVKSKKILRPWPG